MIEIKTGWTGKEACDQHDADRLRADISRYRKLVEDCETKLEKIQVGCDHRHVKIQQFSTVCDVCGKVVVE